jgi:hypothetical protein
MAERERVEAILEELIAVLHLQAKELERLIAHVEQVTTRIPETNDLSVVRSELAALLVRIKKLRGSEGPSGKSASAVEVAR